LCGLVTGLRAIGIADPRRTDPGSLKAAEAQIDGNRPKTVAFKAYLGYLHFGPEDPGVRSVLQTRREETVLSTCWQHEPRALPSERLKALPDQRSVQRGDDSDRGSIDPS
jgi:hypothetical protein